MPPQYSDDLLKMVVENPELKPRDGRDLLLQRLGVCNGDAPDDFPSD